jgi:hypothetical protein
LAVDSSDFEKSSAKTLLECFSLNLNKTPDGNSLKRGCGGENFLLRKFLPRKNTYTKNQKKVFLKHITIHFKKIFAKNNIASKCLRKNKVKKRGIV